MLAGIVLNGWFGCWWANLLAILAIVHCGARKIYQAFTHARFKIVAAIPLTVGPPCNRWEAERGGGRGSLSGAPAPAGG